MKVHRLKSFLVATLAIVPVLCHADPESTEASGQKFTGRSVTKPLRVLIVGSGSSHDFPKHFLGTDAQTLRATGTMDVAATPNLEEALGLLPQADVLLFSGNHDQWGTPEFQNLLNQFADSGKGLVFLHAATWTHPKWVNYNSRFIAGATSGHGKGEFPVVVKDPQHPIMKGVPLTFNITDESYQHTFLAAAKTHVLAENTHEGKTHASVWITEDPQTRIVNITLGHAAEAHENPAFQTILIQAVNWVAGR